MASSSKLTKSSAAGTKRKDHKGESSTGPTSKKIKLDKSAVRPSKNKLPPKPKDNSGLESEEDEVENGDDGADVVDFGDSSVHPDRVKAVADNGTLLGLLESVADRSPVTGQTSRESHAKAKQLAKERKAAKPLADPLARTKKIWERLRRKSHVPKAERDALISELFEIITGRCKDFVLKHDSVRVIQTAIKYSTPEQKRLIAKELAGTYRELAESKYAKFLIGKLLVQGDDQIRDIILPEFFGQVRRMIKHSEASWILDDVYRGVATKQQKAIMLREWYGAEFALSSSSIKEDVTSDLVTILEDEPSKRAPIMRSLHELINHLIQKKMTGFTMLHDAMLQYFLAAKPGTEEVSDFLELVKGDDEGDLLKNLAFTKSGARLVCLVLAHSNAKDRKLILRVYKDVYAMMATDTNAHRIILTAYEVVDDTVLTGKSILPELLSKDNEKQTENVVFYANDLNARTALLYCLQGRSKALFPPSHQIDLDLLAEVDVARATTSKKDPEVRRQELVKALSPYLVKAIENSASNLVASAFGCHFIVEVMFGAEGDKSAALKAVAHAVATDLQQVPAEEQDGEAVAAAHPARSPHGGKMLKSLLAGGRFDHVTKSRILVEPALNFAQELYPAIEPYMESFVLHAPYVISALLESREFEHRDEVLAVIKKNKQQLQKAATQETPEQKQKREALAVADDVSGKKAGDAARTKGKKAKAKFTKTPQVGNQGCALLLELL